MAREQIAPKADQPRVTTGDIARKAEPARIEYRVQSIKGSERGPGKRNYGRSVRG